jgi:hypothetical protein
MLHHLYHCTAANDWQMTGAVGISAKQESTKKDAIFAPYLALLRAYNK